MNQSQQKLKVQFLGTFSLRYGDMEIADTSNRSKKVWLLLAFMIYNRQRSISTAEYGALLWNEESSDDPQNALKTVFHRLRTMLDGLGRGMGKILVCRKNGSYAWNNDFPMEVDIDSFEELIHQAQQKQDEEQKMLLEKEALSLYQNDFLFHLAGDRWAEPIAAYFHNLFLRTVQECVPLLQERHYNNELAQLCRQVILLEPYDENSYRTLMQVLIEMGESRKAAAVYDELSKLLFDELGVLPSDSIREVYQEACRHTNSRALSMESLLTQMEETDEIGGALFCTYDFFKVLYRSTARGIARNGDAVHLCMLTITSDEEEELAKRSLERAMDNMQELVRQNLRKGDTFSKCSVCQFIMMLPQANYENSCMVADRIIKTFSRRYPHSPAKIEYMVQPIKPNY